ncbi:MAG TPA: efflux RND transporter periplasmic adaptor subunit [Candidatus Saccharimonadales bacterium]|nr:efflux RND transporter periplasmic adaptor subunit [Candidatus Saccharimonadales bacterium]
MAQKTKDANRMQGISSWIKKTFFSSRRRTLITVIVIILIIGSWLIFGPKKQQVQYQTAQVTQGTIISTVTESGNVASQSQAGVGSPTTGIVTQMFVKDGEEVTAGENLFKVKSTATAQEIAAAWSSYQSAVTSANNAAGGKLMDQATLEKDRQAVIDASTAVTNMQNNINTSQPNPATKQAYTQNDIDAINSSLTSAQEIFAADQQKYTTSDQNISSAQASENAAWLSYQATQDSVVTAPVSGTVANITVQLGDKVTASAGSLNTSSSTTNSPVLEIGDFSHPYVTVQASEVDAPTIHAGQKATITLSAFPNKTFVGDVSQVDTVGSITSGVVTYSVFVNFVAPPSFIQPGMSATVTIETVRKDNVLTVPSSAVSSATGESTVRVMQNGQVTTVPVTTGVSSDTDTEITSGVTAGETIVTSTVLPTTTSSSSTSSPFSGLGGGRGGFGGGGGAVIRAGGGGGRGGQ